MHETLMQQKDGHEINVIYALIYPSNAWYSLDATKTLGRCWTRIEQGQREDIWGWVVTFSDATSGHIMFIETLFLST